MCSSDAIDLNAVRAALRSELTERGFGVSSDTLGLRGEIYILGDNDLALALFHFGVDGAEAAESIYRSSGSWSAGMPARFVALPLSEAESPAIEMLEQMRTTPVYWVAEADAVTFLDLDRVVADLGSSRERS